MQRMLTKEKSKTDLSWCSCTHRRRLDAEDVKYYYTLFNSNHMIYGTPKLYI